MPGHSLGSFYGASILMYPPWLQVAISSRCYSDNPLVIQGAGAGNDTTAAGVLGDILDLQDLWRPRKASC